MLVLAGTHIDDRTVRGSMCVNAAQCGDRITVDGGCDFFKLFCYIHIFIKLLLDAITYFFTTHLLRFLEGFRQKIDYI